MKESNWPMSHRNVKFEKGAFNPWEVFLKCMSLSRNIALDRSTNIGT